MARATNVDSGNASRQAAAKEQQLSEMRKARRDADDQHQAMLNRISFLRSEEVKLDKDIEAAKRRALELLSRKADRAEQQRDSDLAATARDILVVVAPTLGAQGKGAARPGTGRSSMRSSLLTPSLSAGPLSSSSLPSGPLSSSPASPAQRSASAQRAGRPGAVSQPLRPTKPPLSSPSPLTAKRQPGTVAPAEGPDAACGSPGTSGSGKPPLPGVTPPRPGSREGSGAEKVHSRFQASPTRSSAAAGTAGTASNSAASTVGAAAQVLPPLERTASSSGAAMQRLEAGVGGEAAGLPRQQLQQRRQGGLNRMDTLGNSGRSRAAVEDVDTELIEELIVGTMAAAAGAGSHQQQQLQGLQQFSNEGATRVVHIKTAKTKTKEGGGGSGSAGSGGASPGSGGGSCAVVLAAGVGWGLSAAGSAGAGSPSGLGSGGSLGAGGVVDAAEQSRLKEELARKRKLRGVRKAFGLQPTPLQDTTAQVVECGAGSWQ